MIPEAISETTVMIHLVLTSIASSFHTSPNNMSSLRWANIGANEKKIQIVDCGINGWKQQWWNYMIGGNACVFHDA